MFHKNSNSFPHWQLETCPFLEGMSNLSTQTRPNRDVNSLVNKPLMPVLVLSTFTSVPQRSQHRPTLMIASSTNHHFENGYREQRVPDSFLSLPILRSIPVILEVGW